MFQLPEITCIWNAKAMEMVIVIYSTIMICVVGDN